MSLKFATDRKKAVYKQKVEDEINRGRTKNIAQTGRTESNRKTPALILVDKK